VTKRSRKVIKKFLTDEAGMELSEYAASAALVTLAAIAAFQLLGGNVATQINSLANKLTG
jgi:Flp pilus assembly pilin Flp